MTTGKPGTLTPRPDFLAYLDAAMAERLEPTEGAAQRLQAMLIEATRDDPEDDPRMFRSVRITAGQHQGREGAIVLIHGQGEAFEVDLADRCVEALAGDLEWL